MKKIYNAPVAVIYNALPVQTVAMSLQDDSKSASSTYDPTTQGGGGGGNNDSRDNGNIWDEQW